MCGDVCVDGRRRAFTHVNGRWCTLTCGNGRWRASVNVPSVNRRLYNVVDRARPHTADDLSVIQGGVAILFHADIALSPIHIADQPTTFDVVCRLMRSCARARIGCFAAIVVLPLTNWRPCRSALNLTLRLCIVSYRIVSRYFVWYRSYRILFPYGHIVPTLQ